MKRTVLTTLALVALALPLAAQESPASLVAAYDDLATSILGLRDAEESFVAAILDSHYRSAKRAMKAEAWEEAAAEMAIFANEGDNAVAGIRKRLVEGGHHHNAAGEEQGIYDEGYVLVTRKTRKRVLEISAQLRQATTKEGRQQAWDSFATVADELLKTK
jgi:hypothetical protein